MITIIIDEPFTVTKSVLKDGRIFCDCQLMGGAVRLGDLGLNEPGKYRKGIFTASAKTFRGDTRLELLSLAEGERIAEGEEVAKPAISLASLGGGSPKKA